MTFSLSLFLAFAATGVTAAGSHSVTVQHVSGPVQADYRGRISIVHRQVGSPAPAGRPSTLRCIWTANLLVDRTAHISTGSVAARTFSQDRIASGSRNGWCKSNNTAIARDVAARIGDAGRHVAVAADQDRATLHAELDRLTASSSTG